MNNEAFVQEMEESFERSRKLLSKKEKEYSLGNDRLDQFHRAAVVQNCNPAQALIGMATKHFTSICDMASDPTSHSIKKWDEKLTDLRNYTILMDALVRDLQPERK
jgi:hypothetical protein